MVVDKRFCSSTFQRAEVPGNKRCHLFGPSLSQNCCGKRMFAVNFQRCRSCENLASGMIIQRNNFLNFWEALRQCACLIHGEGIYPAHCLKKRSAFYQYARTGRSRKSGDNAYRCRDHQGAGASNNKHDECLVEPSRPLAGEKWRDYCHQGGD